MTCRLQNSHACMLSHPTPTHPNTKPSNLPKQQQERRPRSRLEALEGRGRVAGGRAGAAGVCRLLLRLRLLGGDEGRVSLHTWRGATDCCCYRPQTPPTQPLHPTYPHPPAPPTQQIAKGYLTLEFGFTAYATNTYLVLTPAGSSFLDADGKRRCACIGCALGCAFRGSLTGQTNQVLQVLRLTAGDSPHNLQALTGAAVPLLCGRGNSVGSSGTGSSGW